MNDKSIRNILIEYLKTQHWEIRIYQEKSIGASVCDLMTVTDCLTGYEIKSDRDNYARLDSQVKAYQRFFDRNYIVVGGAHRKSAYQKVPDDWGIIVIENDAVSVERKAQNSRFPYPSRRDQLGILWKLELKNLLTKANLPLYTYKSKKYIIGVILERLDDEQVKKHIVYELMHRDYSQFDAKDYSLYFSQETTSTVSIQDIPFVELIDTLSEKNLDEFTLDQWIALYRQAKEVQAAKHTAYKKQPKDRTPHAITYQDIEVSPGVPWVSKRIISEFVYFLKTGNEVDSKYVDCVNYEPITGHWYIKDKKSPNYRDKTRIYSTYGLEDYNALFIFEAMLNLREIKLYDSRSKYDEKRTVAALEKQEAIYGLFQEWIWKDEDRRWEIEEAYNTLFGQFSKKEYDGSRLEFPKMSEAISLYPYQKDAVQRIITEKNTLLAFDVGAGKTFIMIAAAMKLRESGVSRKNMFVVPNNIAGQWELIFKKMYPQSRILTVEPKAFKPEMRQKVLKQMRDGDYDGIIIAYSCFEMIPLSGKAVMTQMNQKLQILNEAVDKMSYQSGTGMALARETDYLKKMTKELMDSFDAVSGEVTFDELEIGSLFVDEAHNFKNIPLRTNLRNISGVNTKGSMKCLEMLHKVWSVQEANHGRGVIFATGTPLCNSISDAYAMQMYLQYDLLKNTHLDRFDNWVKSFAKPEQVCEIDVDTSRFRFINRFARFFNLPELSRMFSDIAVFHAMNGEDGLPELNGYDDVTIPRNANLQTYMDKLCERTEKIRRKEIDKSKDNMLKVSTDGRKAALDLRLVGEEQPYNEISKIYRCVQRVLSIYKENPGCAQIIFCDYSTPKAEKFNVYAELKKHFLEEGVPEREIAYIHSYHSEVAKVALYQKVNSGKVRILIGSTFKLGIGANVQTKLKAVHHLDMPWRPADMIQREGRILRKGNENSFVHIYRYIAKGSFDAYSWQILEAKQRFISQFLSNSNCQRSASDLEENVLTYAQVKALAIADPRMKELAEKENELSRLRILSSEFLKEQENRRSRIDMLNEQIAHLTELLTQTTENARYIKALGESSLRSAYNHLKSQLTNDFIFSTQFSTLSFLDFTVSVPEKQDDKKPYILLSRLNAKYAVQAGKSPLGNAKRVLNFVRKLDGLCVTYREQIGKAEDEINQLRSILRQSNPYLSDIQSLTESVKILKGEISSRLNLESA